MLPMTMNERGPSGYIWGSIVNLAESGDSESGNLAGISNLAIWQNLNLRRFGTDFSCESGESGNLAESGDSNCQIR